MIIGLIVFILCGIFWGWLIWTTTYNRWIWFLLTIGWPAAVIYGVAMMIVEWVKRVKSFNLYE